jgi:ABC-type sugar transport system permease subunit
MSPRPARAFSVRTQKKPKRHQGLLVLGRASRFQEESGEVLTTKAPRHSESLASWYVLLIPLFAVLAVVEFYPLLDGIGLSLTGANGNISLATYAQMLGDPAFFSAIGVSLLYTVGSTAVCLVLGLALTFLVTQRVRGRSAFEAIFIFPLALSPIVVGVLWSPSSVWDDIFTFAHYILGAPYINELSPFFYYPVMILSEAWEWAPLVMLVSLSIINSQATQIFEAAELHGASAWRKFTMIGVPTIVRSPVMQFIIVLRLIDAMRAFEIPLAWSNWVGFQSFIGSPVDTLSLFLYKLIFVPIYHFPIGLVSAIAVALLGVTLVVAFAMIRLLGRIGGK